MNPLHIALVGLLNEDGSTKIVGLFHQDAALMQDLANCVAYTRGERRDLAVAHSKRLVPRAAPGMQHFRWSFWGQFNEKLIMRWAFYGSEAKQQECQRWLAKNMSKSTRIVSVPFRPTPQPRDGRE